MILVIDASIIIKWLFQDPERESETERATEMMGAVACGALPVLQPPHWLIEVSAVMARETPDRAEHDLTLLQSMELPICGDERILKRACRLAVQLEHHLFDTLYHAVALESNARLVTADDRYFLKARALTSISRLRDWDA